MSDFGKRLLSGVLLAALLLVDLWAGSWWFAALLGIGALLVFREYVRLIIRGWSVPLRLVWLVFGTLYIGLAVRGLWFARDQEEGMFAALLLFGSVWATDIGAYAFGRLIGGPKVAPSISPNKTWAGFFGGVFLCTLFVFSAVSWQLGSYPWQWGLMICLWGLLACTVIVVLAQGGDFFESWLKRRAGMKDSGTLIPGHGGLFDRVDGLLPVAAVFPLIAGFVVPA